ncbi:hypothetical protein N9901_00860 [Flavobacteriaceae bacterium]|nr:hypothetical protein [Flavobacteriaceae bacterium]
MKNQKTITFISIALFAVYLLQEVFCFKIPLLEKWQADEMFNRWSGLGLAIFILFQWLLTFVRISKKLRIHTLKFTNIHKWIGAFSPLLFYIHSTDFGYGYLGLLSYLFFGNLLLGALNLDIIKSQKEWIFKGWMIIHVGFSLIITLLLFLHIGTVFYYK